MRRADLVRYLVYAGLVALLCALPQLWHSPYYLHVFIVALIWACCAVALRLIFNTGQLSIGQAAFMAIGSYGSVLLVIKLHWTFWAALPLAGIMSSLLAVLIGYPSLRLRGIYFAMVTFAFAEILRLVIVRWRDLTNGAHGIDGIPPPNPIPLPGPFSIQFTSITACFYLTLALFLLTVIVMRRLDKSRVGLTFKAIKEGDALAESIGVNVMQYKMVAFVISGFFTGLAGALYAHYIGAINPDTFGFQRSVDFLVFGVVGGMGSVFGPIVGGVFLTLVSDILLPAAGFYKALLFGILVTMVILFLPQGLIGLPRRMPRGLPSLFGRRRAGMLANTPRKKL